MCFLAKPVSLHRPFFEDQTKIQTVWPQPYFEKSNNCLPNPVTFRFFLNWGDFFEFFAEFPLGRARKTRPDFILGGWLLGAVGNALVCDHKRIQVHGPQTKWPGGCGDHSEPLGELVRCL